MDPDVDFSKGLKWIYKNIFKGLKQTIPKELQENMTMSDQMHKIRKVIENILKNWKYKSCNKKNWCPIPKSQPWKQVTLYRLNMLHLGTYIFKYIYTYKNN